MVELLFPTAAVGVTFLVVVPVLTLLSWGALSVRRARESVWARFGSQGTFALLVAPGLVPALWLASSVIHQSEPWRKLESCLLDHVDESTCADALLLTMGVLLGLVAVLISGANKERPQLQHDRLGPTHPQQERVARIAASSAVLNGLKIELVANSTEPVFTTGWLRPVCFIDACFVESADEDMLLAALLHERAHISARDNLRCFLVRATLALNPLGWLLKNDFLRWKQAREADCDSWAVHSGGQPLALAQSIVQAAKFRCAGPLQCGVTALCGTDAATLKLRVSLLFDGPPSPRTAWGHLLLGAVLLAALVGPHIEHLAYLDHFHLAVERLIHPIS